MIVTGIAVAAFAAASIFSEKFRFFWKKRTGLTYGLSILTALMLGVACDLNGSPFSMDLYDQFITLTAVLILGFPIPLIYAGFRKKDMDYQRLLNRLGKRTPLPPAGSPYGNRGGAPYAAQIQSYLPSTVKGRAKIVKKFSDAFLLNLSDEEIDKIVSGSFQNVVWAREIYAMDQKYISPSEWYRGDTLWLRIYMKVFLTQNITSDIAMQYDIAFSSLNDIFTYADQNSYGSIDECIRDINRIYMTNFDDTTFMLAFRFLESKGMRHRLPTPQVMNTMNEADRLTNKYL